MMSPSLILVTFALILFPRLSFDITRWGARVTTGIPDGVGAAAQSRQDEFGADATAAWHADNADKRENSRRLTPARSAAAAYMHRPVNYLRMPPGQRIDRAQVKPDVGGQDAWGGMPLFARLDI
jgi:hypothetical protein